MIFTFRASDIRARQNWLVGFGVSVFLWSSAQSLVMADESISPLPHTGAATASPPPKSVPKIIVGPAECARVGQRIIAALARDDAGAATQFYYFYNSFRCPPDHVAKAFGCLVNLQMKAPELSNPPPEQVEQCWNEPSKVPNPPPAKSDTANPDAGKKD